MTALKTTTIKTCTIFVVFLFLSWFQISVAENYKIDRLTVGTTMTMNNIDIDDYYFGIMRAMLTHRSLVQLAEKGAVVKDMAESWETTDAKRWVFHLRPKLIWHDGVAVTADDVKFSMEYLLEKIPVYRWHFKLVSNVEKINDRTVVINLSESNPRFLVNLLVLRVIPEHIFKDVANPKQFQGLKAAIGSGPYVFKQYDNASGVIRFEAFERYYRGKPNVREIVFRLFKNPDTLNLAFRKGEIDLPYFYATGTDPVYINTLKHNPDIKLRLMNNPGIPNVLFFNTQKPFVSNPDFRKALSYAINYEEILKLFAASNGEIPNKGFIPEGSLGYIKTDSFSYSPEKARQELTQLGLIDQDEDGIREANGQPVEIEIIARTDTAGSLRLAELLKNYLAAVGVKLSIKAVDNTLFRQISDKERSHTMLLSRTTPWGMMMWAGCGTGYLDSRNIGWSVLDDLKFHSIVDHMNGTLESDVYINAVAELQLYYSDMVPAIPLYWNKMIQPYHKRFTGWVENPMYGFLWEETWFNLTTGD
ncbi:ABC transporter substrate-binding protein [bacterium]|nr:ABC transporter substrate-binding protein [bacterium]